MIKNYLTEEDLKGDVPELTSYLRNGETDFSKQKTAAEQDVISDLADKGYLTYNLRVPLSLRTTGAATLPETGDKSDEDVATRLRLAYNIATLTTPVTMTVQGTNDSTSETWSTVKTVTPTATGEASTALGQAWKYFRLNLATAGGGAINLTADLVDISLDRLFKYKWLSKIFLNCVVEKDDEFYIKWDIWENKYNAVLNNGRIFEDKDESGDVDESEGQTSTQVTFTT